MNRIELTYYMKNEEEERKLVVSNDIKGLSHTQIGEAFYGQDADVMLRLMSSIDYNNQILNNEFMSYGLYIYDENKNLTDLKLENILDQDNNKTKIQLSYYFNENRRDKDLLAIFNNTEFITYEQIGKEFTGKDARMMLQLMSSINYENEMLNNFTNKGIYVLDENGKLTDKGIENILK